MATSGGPSAVRGWLRGARPIATARRPLLIEGTSYRQSGPVDDVWLRRRSQPRKTLAGVIHLPVADGENRALPQRLFGRVRDDDAADVLFAFLGSQTSA